MSAFVTDHSAAPADLPAITSICTWNVPHGVEHRGRLESAGWKVDGA